MFKYPDKLDQFLYENSFLAPGCGMTNRVCHGRENVSVDFFVYNTFFADLYITLPFDNFTMGSFRLST